MSEAFKHEDFQTKYLPVLKELEGVFRKILNIKYCLDDNNLKTGQIMLACGLRGLGTKDGNDAEDADGNQYELKSTNMVLTKNKNIVAKQFNSATNLSLNIIERFRTVPWLFGTFDGVELHTVYRLEALDLEPYFSMWQKKIEADPTQLPLRNPAISFPFVRDRGRIVYPVSEQQVLNVKFGLLQFMEPYEQRIT